MANSPEYVEGVTASLIREYLSRKGLTQTLAMLDAELPRGDNSISNRSALAKALHMEKMMKKNKEQEHPFRAMIELMTKYFLEKPVSVRHMAADPSSVPAINDSSIEAVSSSSINNTTSSHAVGPGSGTMHVSGSTTGSGNPLSLSASKSNRGLRQTGDLVLEDSLEGETFLGDGRVGVVGKGIAEPSLNISGLTPRPRNSQQRGMAGGVISSLEDRDKRRYNRGKMSKPGPLYAGTGGSIQTSPDSQPAFLSNSMQRVGSAAKQLELSDSARRKELRSNDSTDNNQFNDILTASSVPRRRPSETVTDEDFSYNIKQSSISGDRPPTRAGSARRTSSGTKRNQPLNKPSQNSVKPVKPTQSKKVGDVEFGDCDDLESELNDLDVSVPVKAPQPTFAVDSKPIDLNSAVDLKKLIFGTANQNFNDEWKYQAFTFCDLPGLLWGIVQKKGGPCGVLAAVQACMLHQMLFADKKRPTIESLNPSRQERSEALAVAMSRIFWRAGEQKKAVVAIPSGRAVFTGGVRVKADDLTETLVLNNLDNFENLVIFMKQNISQFECDGCSGVIIALYSVILSRGFKNVISDMDEPTNQLMGAHGYCTQDMVNLFMTGHAVSNVFNDKMELDSGSGPVTLLKGIQGRSDIGLMSLFEHYKSCQVGTYLKTPRFPIWVVCSESHFSVLFSLKRELVSDWKAERRFDLYYYDGLGRQEEQIKLTVDTTNRFYVPPSDDDLVPPLELCIRTKWPGAEVDWNGTEPLL